MGLDRGKSEPEYGVPADAVSVPAGHMSVPAGDVRSS